LGAFCLQRVAQILPEYLLVFKTNIAYIKHVDSISGQSKEVKVRGTALGFAQVMVDRVLEAGIPITYTFNEIDPIDEICDELQHQDQVTYDRIEADRVRVNPVPNSRRKWARHHRLP